jgi:hypothetical protein
MAAHSLPFGKAKSQGWNAQKEMFSSILQKRLNSIERRENIMSLSFLVWAMIREVGSFVAINPEFTFFFFFWKQ